MSSPRQRKTMSLEEAEIVLYEEARCKNFWTVYDTFDNRDLLQDAVDVVFNTVPGNKYNIEYMENQNSCRLMVQCVPCGKDLSSYDPFITHEKGKAHNKVRQQQLCPKDPNLSHALKRKPHNTYKGIFDPSSLEHMVDSSDIPMLGMQFLYKVKMNDKYYFTCTLCLTTKGKAVRAVSKRKMYDHLAGQSHCLNYMRVKFRVPETDASIYSVIKNMEKFEGKIHTYFTDFTNQMLVENAKKEESKATAKMKREREEDDLDSLLPKDLVSRPTSKRRTSKDLDELLRSRSPVLFNTKIESEPLPLCKEEPMSPNMSSRISPVMFPCEVQTQSVTRQEDASTSTEFSLIPSIKVLEEDLDQFRHIDALDLIQKDSPMQTLLIEGLMTLNKQLKAFFLDHNTNCWNDVGALVSPAYDAAENLEKKHLSDLQVIVPEKDF